MKFINKKYFLISYFVFSILIIIFSGFVIKYDLVYSNYENNLIENKTEEKNKINWSSILGILGFLMSIILGSIKIYDKFLLKPKVFGKIISLTSSPKAKFEYDKLTETKIVNKKLSGIAFIIKLNLFIKNKSLNFKDIKIKIKFPEDDEIYDATICYSCNGFNFDPIGLFQASSEDFLDFNSYLSIDEKHNYYLYFIVEKETSREITDINFEYIKISFINENDKIIKLNTLYLKDIDSKKMLFEAKYWKE